jgi:hypothetical protein
MKTILSITFILLTIGCTKKVGDKIPTTYSNYTLSYDTVFYGSGLDTGSNFGTDTIITRLTAYWGYSNTWTFSVPAFDNGNGAILDSVVIVTYTNLKVTNVLGPIPTTERDTLSLNSVNLLIGNYNDGGFSTAVTDTNSLMNAVEASRFLDSSLSQFEGTGVVQFKYSALTTFTNPSDQAGNVMEIVPSDSTAISITYFYKKPS